MIFQNPGGIALENVESAVSARAKTLALPVALVSVTVFEGHLRRWCHISLQINMPLQYTQVTSSATLPTSSYIKKEQLEANIAATMAKNKRKHLHHHHCNSCR